MALQTSGTISDITWLDILNRKCRLLKLSPVARNRSVTAKRTLAGIASLHGVSFFFIFGSISWRRYSKSVADILQKLSNSPEGSRNKLLNN